MNDVQKDGQASDNLVCAAEVVVSLLAIQIRAEQAGMIVTAARLSALRKLAAAEFDMIRAASGDLASGKSVVSAAEAPSDQSFPPGSRPRFLC